MEPGPRGYTVVNFRPGGEMKLRCGNLLRRSIGLQMGVLLLGWTAAYGWGPNGHRIVGEIARRYLNPQANRVVEQLLDGEKLAHVGTWADEIRSDPRWECAAPFHFTTIPPGQEYFQLPAPPQGDVLGAIVFFTAVLSDSSRSRQERVEALKFLVHFVADLHQPLHAGLGCDRGGNDVAVEWLGEAANLHSVWDSGIVESAQLSYSEYAALLNVAEAEEVASIQHSDPLQWAVESQQILLQDVYRCSTLRDRCPCFCGDCTDGFSTFGGCVSRMCTLSLFGPVNLGAEYRDRARPIVERRLLEGGVRLASLINAALSPAPFPEAFLRFEERVRRRSGWEEPFVACAAPR